MRLTGAALALTALGLAVAGFPLGLLLLLPSWCALVAAYRAPLLRLLAPLYDELRPAGERQHQGDDPTTGDHRDML